ncbi:MAG: Multimodular transpeptidase-transglycosylase (EC (EC [uncultured Thiotrichaceae bacterium]|uniref:peptidoglycan glycosyltransferase n=1 Tax=uncultured Thiotrichaceae bacterium TaxID=298394 RepID=A0A6S6U1K9_9GAMM|nr:MAG: Multimodular transpeptidase-transglycosylase (EC (EC [uncultured Thiotrichaceae bacterium]
MKCLKKGINKIKPKSRWLLIFFIFGGLILWYADSLPKKLFNASYSSIIFASNGELLGAHIASDQQWRFPLIETLPDKFSQSLIQFEDKRFYKHPGIDPFALMRATWLNLKHASIKSGASTLTMQVIRLSKNNPPRTFFEKIKEIILATRLEIRLGKNDILRLYASHAPFGGNVVGVEAAAWRYFGRSPAQLSWAESAMLAVLPNSPGLIHPGRGQKVLLKKRNRLLQRLRDKKIITNLDYSLAISEPLPHKPKELPRLAPHLLDTLNKITKQQRMSTTLKYTHQKAANEVIGRYAERLALAGIHNQAALIINNKTFEVIAYVGNASDQQTGEHGHAIDLIRRPRSTGSTLKPFLFAYMIEDGEILPETLVVDVPVRYAGFRPQNYDRGYRGVVRAKSALASSLNIPAANMLSRYGVARFLDKLQNMGMTTLHRRPENYGLPLILGGSEGTLWDLTNMYANLAFLANQTSNQQAYHWRQAHVRQQTKTTNAGKAVDLSIASAWMTLNTLLEVSRPGTEGFWKKFTSTQKIAWKTGTSFGQRDAWAIGTTPDYTIGVWTGNANGQGVAGLTGVNIAAPILFSLFDILPHQDDWFKKPEWQMKKIAICENDGFLAANQCKTKTYDIPVSSFFERISPYHRVIHLDQQGQFQVHNGCESVANMQSKSWFLLPPNQAYYYQQHAPNYQTLPPFRADCQSNNLVIHRQSGLHIQYPGKHTQIYIPIDIDGKASKTVFRANHSSPEKNIYWHLNESYLGSTQTFHEMALWIKPGEHKLTLVDEDGQQDSRQFTVIAR